MMRNPKRKDPPFTGATEEAAAAAATAEGAEEAVDVSVKRNRTDVEENPDMSGGGGGDMGDTAAAATDYSNPTDDAVAAAAAAAADAVADALPFALASPGEPLAIADLPNAKVPHPPKKEVSPVGPPAHQMGMKLNPSDPLSFDHFLFQLILFKADNNNFHVTKEENPELHTWLYNLKREYKNFVQDKTTSHLTDEQMRVLEFLHVPLTSRGDEHWNRFFQLLQQYKERHGHVLVPRLCEVPGLGDWVTDQRRQYKSWKQGQPTQLTKERREKLEELGFAWQVRNRPEWEHRFNELLDYKKEHGDCKVPQHYKPNRALGKWVAKQREQYKLYKKGQHSFLTPYRLEKLNSAGFVWQVRTALEGELGGDGSDQGTADADETDPAESVATSIKDEAAGLMEVEASDVPAVPTETAAANTEVPIATPNETVEEPNARNMGETASV